MSRPSRVRALALGALLAAAGCQDYNFNPVGHCLISPNTKRVQLSSVTRADVLFVVDDSGSMAGEQAKLSAAFDQFASNLDTTNQQRVADGREPIDFHLAVTTTSVFFNDQTSAACRTDCPNAGADGAICCNMSGTTPVSPYKTVQTCTGASDTSCRQGTCRQDCQQWLGDWVCCSDTTKAPALDTEVSCSAVGDPCGTLRTHYWWDPAAPGCTAGLATNWNRYPQGDFVGAAGAPRVIHYDKTLYKCATPPCHNLQGYTADQLKGFFTANVIPGTCGSDQEQPLEAAKRAVEKALADAQIDTRTTDSSAATTAAAKWLKVPEASKLVLVFVGDEDDCSSPQDASGGVVLNGRAPGDAAEACMVDRSLAADKQKETSIASFVDYFTSLPGDHPLGAAFIVSATSAGSTSYCQDETCRAGYCMDSSCGGRNNVCGGQAPGNRLLEAAEQLRNKQSGKTTVDVVAGSVCDPDFGVILNRVADIVKPPIGLALPSQPAAADVSVLRIARSDGKTRKTCRGPAPADLDAAAAKAAGWDWWYTAGRDQVLEADQHPTVASKFVYINHDPPKNCEADSGETYSMDYIARLPTTGCSGATAEEADASCVSALGGRPGDWTCFDGTDASGYCTTPTGGAVVGTCICGARYVEPPAGTNACTPAAGNCPWGCTENSTYCPSRAHDTCASTH